jgi:very-short-patch-repair endonuclease
MRSRRLALTGPSAAALYELDGFRDLTWPDLWCAPYTGDPGDRIVRTRAWIEPTLLGDVPVCPIETVIRHLNAVPSDLLGVADGLAPQDRVELAAEHALRQGVKLRAAAGGAMTGDEMLRKVLARRGSEPPTESYAETRAVQVFRTFGLRPWRQIPILENGRIVFRADFMLPFIQSQRPDVIRTSLGLLIEIDGREFHEPQFERDHRRGSTYDTLGFNWVSFTPTQIETQPKAVQKAICGAFSRAGYPLT